MVPQVADGTKASPLWDAINPQGIAECENKSLLHQLPAVCPGASRFGFFTCEMGISSPFITFAEKSNGRKGLHERALRIFCSSPYKSKVILIMGFFFFFYSLYFMMLWHLEDLAGWERLPVGTETTSLWWFSSAHRQIQSQCPEPPPLSNSHTPSQGFLCPKSPHGQVLDIWRPTPKAQSLPKLFKLANPKAFTLPFPKVNLTSKGCLCYICWVLNTLKIKDTAGDQQLFPQRGGTNWKASRAINVWSLMSETLIKV